jgi:uncharacterized protein YejL (UPF0352 family)
MSNWLADRLGVHLNLRPLAPIAGAIVGNALLPGIGGAALGAGLGRFADGVGNNEGFGQAAKAGVVTGGATYAGGKGLEALRGAFAPSSIGEQAGAVAAPGSGVTGADIAPTSSAGGGFSFGNVARSVGSFLDKHPGAVSMGLQGLGNIATAGAQNDLARAQVRHLASADDAADYDLQLRRNRDANLEPIRQALAGQLSALRANKYGIAPNPYLTTGIVG